MAGPVILVEAQPRRVDDGAAVTVRLAGGGGTLPYRYGGLQWRAGITGLPTIVASIDFRGDDLGGGGVAQAAVLRWAPARSAAVAEMAAYHWIDAAVTVRIGPEGPMPPVLLSGRILSAGAADGVLEIALADPAADLKKPVLTERFKGTGGLEGPLEWEGRIRRRAWGRVFNVQGFAIDPANSIHCFGDPARPWQAFDAVRDKGAAAAQIDVLEWQGSAEATFAALQAADAPQGGGVACPSIACVKWWTQPAGALCADIRGEIGAGYVETAPQIVTRIVAAVTALTFAPGTVAAATSIRNIAVGCLVGDDATTAAQLLDQLLGDVSLMWLLDGDDITIRAWEWTAPVAVARSHDVSRRSTFKPVAKRKLGFRRNHHMMQRDAIAGIVLATDVLFPEGENLAALKPAAPGATPGAPGGWIVGGELDPQTGEVTGGVEAGELVQAVEDTAEALVELETLVADQVERIDGEVAEANGRIDSVQADLDEGLLAVDAQIAATQNALRGARAQLAYQYERLEVGIASTRIGVLAEYRERVSAIGVEIERIDGIIATLDDPTTGLVAAHGLIATLESITIEIGNPLSLASKLAVLEAAIEDADAALSGRVSTLEAASAQYADDIADLGDGLAILDGGLVAAQQDIADNAGGLVALGGRTTLVEAELVAQADDIADTQAELVEAVQAVALEKAAGLYRAERAAVQAGLSRVATLAEARVRATERDALYEAVDDVALLITSPSTGLSARLTAAETALVTLDGSKASVAALDALSAAVTTQSGRIDDLEDDYTGLGGRVTTAEAAIVTQASAIAALDLDLGALDGALAVVAGDLADMDDRLGDVEGVAGSLVSTTSALTAAVSDLDDRQSDSEAEIVAVAAAGVTARAAVTYQAERAAAAAGLGRVTALAERRLTSDAFAVTFARIDAVELEAADLGAALVTVESAVLDLEEGKASVSRVEAVEARTEDVEAQVLINTSAIAGLETGSAGFEVLVAASGSNPAQVRLTAGPGGSGVDVVSDRAVIRNPVNGDLVEVARFEGGVARMNSALIRNLKVAPRADSAIFLDVQLRPLVRLASDGQTVQFDGGKTFGAAPERIVADLTGLPALPSGERYDVRATAVTPSGFTARIKKLAVGSIATETSGAGSNVGGTPAWRTDKPTVANAYNQYYEFVFTVAAALAASEPTGLMGPGGEVWWNQYRASVQLYAYDGSAWVQIGGEEIAFDNYSEGGSGPGSESQPVTLVAQSNVSIPDGANMFGVHATLGAISAFAHVRYDIESASSETAVAGMVAFTVYPPLPGA